MAKAYPLLLIPPAPPSPHTFFPLLPNAVTLAAVRLWAGAESG